MHTADQVPRLLGAVLVGDTEDYSNLLQLFLNGIDLPLQPESLILPNVEKPVMGVENLPDTATLCSCYNVSKGQICAAVDNGAMTYEDIKICTKASTGCGGCAQIVKDTLVSELKKRGIEVKRINRGSIRKIIIEEHTTETRGCGSGISHLKEIFTDTRIYYVYFLGIYSVYISHVIGG